MNFATVTGLIIPEGEVVSITRKSDGAVLWKRKGLLPSPYRQVEYIETDGDQYIDTGVNASDHADGISYEMSGQVTGYKNASGNNYFFGCLAGSSRSGNVSAHTGNKVMGVYIGGSAAMITGNISILEENMDFNLFLTAASSKDAISGAINGVAFTKYATVTVTTMPNANIYLFSAYGVADTNGKYWGKLYSFTMTAADGTLIRSFVPCYRVADGVIGLYDTVGGVFYENSGTGSFQKGADV